MSDLWSDQRAEHRDAVRPLPARLRPRTLDEVVGHGAILAEGGLLRRLVAADRVGSVILTGPPGTGKTTLAEVIGLETGRVMVRAHAAMVGVKEIRAILEASTARIESGGPGTILFLDEIHRFSKSQQDVLLPDVERGTITLVGATTENPWFAVNAALVSRSTVVALDPLEPEDIESLLRRAITDPRGFGDRSVNVDDDALAWWASAADGDARRALSALEVAVLAEPGPDTAPVHIDRDAAIRSMPTRALRHDADGDAHYDLASVFIKSMRAGEPDAATHWLAAMIAGGEDPRFIARRLVIFASEDVGPADPNALPLAMAAWHAVERVGMPEGRIPLAQAVRHCARAPKSRDAIDAIDAALADVREGRRRAMPEARLDRRSVAGRVSAARAAGDSSAISSTSEPSDPDEDPRRIATAHGRPRGSDR